MRECAGAAVATETPPAGHDQGLLLLPLSPPTSPCPLPLQDMIKAWVLSEGEHAYPECNSSKQLQLAGAPAHQSSGQLPGSGPLPGSGRLKSFQMSQDPGAAERPTPTRGVMFAASKAAPGPSPDMPENR